MDMNVSTSVNRFLLFYVDLQKNIDVVISDVSTEGY
jgi:hypothetical protein